MKRKFIHRLLSFVLTVLILCVSVGNAFISVNDISVTHAAGPFVLGYDVMYEICRSFGSVFYGYSCARELPEVNFHDDDMARLGHDLMVAMLGNDLLDPRPDPGDYVGDWEAYDQAMIAYCQRYPNEYYYRPYVFGTEALKETAETDFTVIQGGKNDGDGDDDDDDDDDNVIHFPKQVGDAVEGFIAFTAAGAAAIAKGISDQYQKWVNGEPDSILADFLANFNDTFSGYESIQNADGSYNISGYSSGTNSIGNQKIDYIYHDISMKKVVAYLSSDGGYSLNSVTKNGSSVSLNSFNCFCDVYVNGVLDYSTNRFFVGGTNNYCTSWGVNIPVFSTYNDAVNACKSDDYTGALNYAKTYRVADWLADDEYWKAQKLLDPLTGLNALSNWYNIARHQGLNALGQDPAADDLASYLRDYFANLGTDRLPEVDSSLAPIKYPSYVEDVIIDPAANPSVYPAPGSNPGTSPGTGKDPGTDPGTDPSGGTGSDTDVDMDENDYKVDLRGIFPFCIPFDFVALLNVLDTDPVAPRFDFPVVIPALNYQDSVVLDMSMFDDVAKVIRICEKVSFVIFLMFATSKVIRW